MEKAEVREIIQKLKNSEIQLAGIPEECKNEPEVAAVERQLGLRITGRRGFDIISDSFFVEEERVCIDEYGDEHEASEVLFFESFKSYYDFLNGDIYDNACYAFHHIPDSELRECNVNAEMLMEQSSFIDDTIDDYTILQSKEEKEFFQKAENVHKQCKRWIKKFNACKNGDELSNTVSNYRKSKLFPGVTTSFFLFNYVFEDVNDKERFSTIMEYLSSGDYPEHSLINALCSIYDPADVKKSFNYARGAKGTIYRHKKKLKDYISLFEGGKVDFFTRAFFDTKTHYYCEETRGFERGNTRVPITRICRYFETFEEFVKYRSGDLTNCDLSSVYGLDVNFSKYTTDLTTKLPVSGFRELQYTVSKYYQRGKFYVVQEWRNHNNEAVKTYGHTFPYFFDFVAFLKGDLSGADLLLCDGLEHLRNWENINFEAAKMRSALCEKFGLKYNAIEFDPNSIKAFECIEQNETETSLVLQATRALAEDAFGRNVSALDIALDRNCQRVDYISDIHLMHRINEANCRSKEDVEYVIWKIVSSIADEAGRLLLIAGDVASNFTVFQMFVKMLSKVLRKKTTVVFVLGNHELWGFPDLSLNDIVLKYRTFLDEYGMFLLHNDVMFKEGNWEINDPKSGFRFISYEQLCALNDLQITDQLRSARYVILGGLGFSGYNTEFNADNGIYWSTVDRITEVNESQKFEALYWKLHPVLCKKNTIIFTHTPKKDWCKEKEPDSNYIYVSGHTHRNFFYDDGEYRVYSDNQIGYHNNCVHLKSLLIDNDYDCFEDYPEGIFEITSDQYRDFYRGKNIQMTFQRKVFILYMLKKKGYYCFLHLSDSGTLTILNGGAIKKVETRSIQYYYDHMDDMITKVKAPLEQYTSFQMKIATTIKAIGGNGTIHGCIVDIDYFNHIYVNPIDQTVTGYWAEDIVNKIVYPSVPALLEKKCPQMYDRYITMIGGDVENPLIVNPQNEKTQTPQIYLDTSIYLASRRIRAMQKLNSNILSFWYEDGMQSNRLTSPNYQEA